jgi:SWI/SNF-related matrix-associated actin-dependent regulator 1 of chromatin subfamily A
MLRDYQQQDVNEILKHDSIGIFNEQRTGKTPTSITAITQKTRGRILVVCTASMLYKWQQEIKQWSDRPVAVYTGTPAQRTQLLEWYPTVEGAFLIVSYDLLKETKRDKGIVDKMLKANIQGLIVDEAHRAVGRKTANFKSLRKLVKIPHRYYLTGTPAPNHPSQVWSILTMIAPKVFSSYWRFVEDFFEIDTQRLPAHVAAYAGVDKIDKAGAFKKGKDKVFTILLGMYSIQRKRLEVMPWLKPLDNIERILLPCTKEQLRYLDEISQYYETEHVVTQGILDQLLRMRQICLAPAILGLKGGSPKLDWLYTFHKEYGEAKIVIFSRFTQFIRLIEAKLGGVAGVIVGDVSPKDRQHLIDDFQNGTLRILIIQIDAGKEGLTLDAADYLIFTDIYPPASDILQARDRIVATSHARNTTKMIVQLAMADTYDARLYDLVEEKVELTAVANDYKNYMEVHYGKL